MLKNNSVDFKISSAESTTSFGLFSFLGVGEKLRLPPKRPFSYSTKEPGSSVIFIHFYTKGVRTRMF